MNKLKKCIHYILAAVLVITLCAGYRNTALAASGGFKVSGTKLYDSNGNEFIMRGVNYPHAWYTSEYETAIPAIARKGFNCVRIVLANGQKWGKTSYNEVSVLIDLCKKNNLVAILEVHDATGSSGDNSQNSGSGNTTTETGKTNLFYGNSYASHWWQAVSAATVRNNGNANVTDMGEGDFIWVEYTGAYGDYDLVFQSYYGGNSWAKISPSENGVTERGTYYSKFYYNDIVKVYGRDFSTVDMVHISAHENGITVKSVDIVY